MTKDSMKIVFVGHVDHGKSTLIGRLLHDTNSLPEGKIEEIKHTCDLLGKELEFAFILDSLQEEREQSVTIDTTQIFFNTDKKDYTIIDAPGHKEFLKNMITGATQAEAAILIVDSEEGVQEQTKRHAYLLNFLGIKKMIVVVNKMDITNYSEDRFNEVKNELLKFLSSFDLEPIITIPISAKKGDNITKKSDNMKWYDGPSIAKALDEIEIEKTDQNKELRFPIQDVYKFEKERIYAGRIESGELNLNDSITFLPSKKETKVKLIKKFNETPESAKEGECIGITLEDPIFLERGEVAVMKEGSPKTADKLNANIFWMSKKEFNIKNKLKLKCATQEVECKIEEINKKMNSSSLEIINEDLDKIKEIEVVRALIKTERPIVFEDVDLIPELGRFVLTIDDEVVAGGTIEE